MSETTEAFQQHNANIEKALNMLDKSANIKSSQRQKIIAFLDMSKDYSSILSIASPEERNRRWAVLAQAAIAARQATMVEVNNHGRRLSSISDELASVREELELSTSLSEMLRGISSIRTICQRQPSA